MKSLPEIRNSTLKQIKEKISYMLTKIKSSLLLINLNFQVSIYFLFMPLKLPIMKEHHHSYIDNFCSCEKKARKKINSGFYECCTGITEVEGSNPIQA